MSEKEQKKESPIRNDGEDLKAIFDLHVTPKSYQGQEKLSQAINIFDVTRTSDITTNSIMDARTVMQVHPELELAKQIVVTNILSPKDVMSTELTFTCDVETLGSELSNSLLEIVSDHFENEYPFVEQLPTILSEALFETGSKPIIVLPENSIDHLINSPEVTLESFDTSTVRSLLQQATHPLGFIGGSKESSTSSVDAEFESYGLFTIPASGVRPSNATSSKEEKKNDFLDETKISFEDNFNLLKLPLIRETLTRVGTRSILYAQESKDPNASPESAALLDKLNKRLKTPRQFRQETVRTVKTSSQLSRPTRGHGLIMQPPAESMVPVLIPGTNTPASWLMLLDEQGYPLRNSVDTDRYKEISARLRKDSANQIPEQIKNAYSGNPISLSNDEDIKRFNRLWSTAMERDIKARIRNGINKGNIDIKVSPEMQKLMMARSLEGQATRLLYIPAELVTYFAFDWNEYGVGVSLLERNKIISGLRTILRFNDTYAAVKNSTNNTVLNITLDEKDTDPARTVEELVYAFIGINTRAFPLGANSPADLLDYVQKAGISVNVEGNNNYPATKMAIEDKGRNIVRPDNDLSESLRKDNLMGLLVTPEMVDLSMGADFATTVATSNIMFGKRMMVLQDALCELIEDHVTKVIDNSSILKTNMLKKIKEHLADLPESAKDILNDGQQLPEDELIVRIYEVFLATLEANLPKPDYNSIETLSDGFGKYMDGVDKVLDILFSEDNAYGLAKNKLAEEIKYLRSSYRGLLARKWMVENGYMTDLLRTNDDDEETIKILMTELADYTNRTASLAKDLALKTRDEDKKLQSFTDKLDNLREQAGEPEATPMEGGDYSSSSDDDSLDDFSMDESDDTPPELPDLSETDVNDTEDKEDTDGETDVEDSEEKEEESEEPPELPESGSEEPKKE